MGIEIYILITIPIRDNHFVTEGVKSYAGITSVSAFNLWEKPSWNNSLNVPFGQSYIALAGVQA